ncbi:uncharacterized protein GGS25DRAFT_331807 [Hypoxylon fragiforme]|uniref:uncharacterized protein n=1 Tax=Hypoxylon fragiforme TaxID=63214 RepID=UPI0020C6FA04|nr:uncharacterized protein GGS25DRAFT_331807 [Hypoxylon fragiforme]KAI2607407.1 hypothetical protein GGS25DRAFT_331807 [Hypoxylon fragiforme]
MAAVPFRVKAVYEYTSSHEDDLPFGVGQIITVTEEEDADWYAGEYVDSLGVKQEGIFPRNFVEKYEPTAPPRPTRSRKKELEPTASSSPPPGPPASPPPAVEESAEIPLEIAHQDPRLASPTFPPPVPHSPPTPVAPVAKPPEPASISAPVPVETKLPDPSSPIVPTRATPKGPAPGPPKPRAGPPPVSEKPAIGSFKDRIAAFNKPAAPPVTPFKPSGLSAGSSGFVKKPFIAPPPSRNAYVAPPRDIPATKIYRRDEDPEIKATQAESQENAERAGLLPAASIEGQDEDQPKPTSLKERIALLQKQQAEAAQRHAEAAAKKEKPKRPPKKRMESEEGAAVSEAVDSPPVPERKDTAETASKKSLDESRPPRQGVPARRKSSAARAENDGNEADMSGAGDTTEGQEDLTERDDSDEKSRPHTGEASEPTAAESTEIEEEEEIDPEVRRKEELRARMAKMSGGMGFPGLFNPAGMMPLGGPALAKKPKPPPPTERRSNDIERPSSPRMAAPPIPVMMPLPGMAKQKQPEEEVVESDHEEPSNQEITPVVSAQPTGSVPEPLSESHGGPPPVPAGRPAPPPVPTDSRPPPLPPTGITSPSQGSESDDELSENPQRALETPRGEHPPPTARVPPIPLTSPVMPTSPRGSARRPSYMGEEGPPSSPPSQLSKRNSRPPPPIPSAAAPPTQGRPPPPPPPGPPSRSSTADERPAVPMRPGALDNGEEGEVTEYEGDYDTDIASSVPHKDALKSHARDSSFDDSTSLRSPVLEAPSSLPPAALNAVATRAPPPPPSHPAPGSRQSVDAPRAVPPPPPKEVSYSFEDEDYDPYNYNAAANASAPTSRTVTSQEQPTQPPQSASSYNSPTLPPPGSRGPPPAPPVNRLPIRKSLDARRSVDATRPSMETGFVANEIDLAVHTQWWLSATMIPPIFQGRRDIYTEVGESTSGTSVTKEVSILFQDYSQTVITVRFDSQAPTEAVFEQRHEAPPRSLRQDELEEAYERFGRSVASAVASKKDTVVGDGTPQALILELLKPLKDALLPVGTRAYGALVYANLANASTQQNDEIRPGDIVSIRNAKFQGKHGPMHAKYSMEVGKPDHVAIVSEWDGTKKKVRAWEQGRESKKVKQESFKLEDLRSGEVKIWRLMPRSWIGWSSD